MPEAHVVKPFNTVFAQHMDKGSVRGHQLTILAASDDEQARNIALGLGRGRWMRALCAMPGSLKPWVILTSSLDMFSAMALIRVSNLFIEFSPGFPAG
jgi:predicted dinucleotide-binding enzyme